MENNLKNPEQWAKLAEVAPADVVASLKKLAAAFDGKKIIEWMANLWEPEVGGFYYNNSARDTEGFAPDIESTHQLINMLCANASVKRENLPEDFKAKMLNFIKSCQSPDDGYFYHPQWPKGRENLQNDRYGRDLNWSTAFINLTTLDEDGDGVQKKQYPNYCILGHKCKKHAGTDERCVFPPDPPKPASASAASSSKPDFSSREAFSAWLEQYNANAKEHSGRAHQLSSLGGIISNYGYTDIVLDHLDKLQEEIYQEQLAAGEEPMGVWQKQLDYLAVWGLLKYGTFYNNANYGREIKHAEEIIKTCIKVIALPPEGNYPPDGCYRMNDMFNQWLGINTLINNLKRFNPEKVDVVRKILCEDVVPLIDNSLLKIQAMALDDGTFTYTSDRHSLKRIYGVPISLGLEESDVNCMALVTIMYRGVFLALGYDPVDINDAEDVELFFKIIGEAKPPVKKPNPNA